jgi:hypothetical protein
MVGDFALLIDGHQGSKVASAKKLLALVQEASGLGETPWAQRDLCVLTAMPRSVALKPKQARIGQGFLA